MCYNYTKSHQDKNFIYPTPRLLCLLVRPAMIGAFFMEVSPMPNFINRTGDKYGRLSVLRLAPRKKGAATRWACLCDCGKETTVLAGHLNSGHTQSCGCLQKELALKSRTTHGKYGTPTYKAWSGMLGRCQNRKDAAYQRYGSRGIGVCKRWESFENFHSDMGDRPSKAHSLDRIDNNAGYSPDNCRWATLLEQANNTRRNRRITFEGRTLTMSQWARRTGFNVQTIWARFNKGWSVEDALTINPEIGKNKR